MFLWLKTLYRKRAVTWPFIFYTIIWTLSGWAFLVVIMILIANTLIKFYKKKEYKFIIIYIIICINCLVATFFYSVPVNPFILGIFSNIYNDKES